MSGSLLEVKKKVNGVKNTRKITKAMQLVAASKMRQFQKKALFARSYVVDLYKSLQKNLEPDFKSIYTTKKENGRTLFVLYTSDKGLCGPLNTKLTNALFKSRKWTSLSKDQRALITIGKKSFNFAQNNNIPIEKSFIGIPEKFTGLDVLKIVDAILELWKKGGIKEVLFIAPHYKNSFTFYPIMKSFLPFSKEGVRKVIGAGESEIFEEDEENNDDESLSEENSYMLYSPSQEIVLKKLYEQIIQSMFIQSFLELKASEYSSRMIAMQNATDSADRMISDLNLTYNKARQQAITQEIAELVGASMALEA